MEEMNARKTPVSYEIKKHLTTLFRGGMPEFSKEVNLISWNRQPPKLDIRRWENGYPRKGVSLSSLEAQTLFDAFRSYFDDTGSKPYHNPGLNGCAVDDPERVSYKIQENLAVLSVSENGYTREVNVISWNHGPEKIDIRSWSPERVCTRGITLRMPEAMALYEILKDVSGGFLNLEETVLDHPETA